MGEVETSVVKCAEETSTKAEEAAISALVIERKAGIMIGLKTKRKVTQE